jgi:NAD(P)-dependent dehydrogenase (short-subunit alcohol dehydrogenase family)
MKGENIFDLSGKVALVTGGSGGLGRLFCETLAEFGADISLTADKNVEGAKETAGLVKGFGRRSLAIRADVGNADDVERMVSETVATLGRIDILVNNAAINSGSAKIADMRIEDWDRVLAVNLRGAFLCTRAALPSMIKQGKGNIINIASIKGSRTFREVGEEMPIPNYSVSKAGMIMLTMETAVEYAREGIRANCIAPGWHLGTQLSNRWREGFWKQEQYRRYEEGILRVVAMGRRGDASELKGLIVYLASDASSYMTGQVLNSDGGACI